MRQASPSSPPAPAACAAARAHPVIRPAAGHAEIRAAQAVRVAVFVLEQGGPPGDEPDAWDAASRHFVVLDGGEVVGTARIYLPSLGVGKIGRVALLPHARGRGWGRLLLEELIAYALSLGLRDLLLDSQADVCPFYARFEFVREGEPFMEAGILHQRMRKCLRRSTER